MDNMVVIGITVVAIGYFMLLGYIVWLNKKYPSKDEYSHYKVPERRTFKCKGFR